MAVAKQHTSVHSLAGTAGNSGTGVCWNSEHPDMQYLPTSPDTLLPLCRIVTQSLSRFYSHALPVPVCTHSHMEILLHTPGFSSTHRSIDKDTKAQRRGHSTWLHQDTGAWPLQL
jgi:hypothetical protein